MEEKDKKKEKSKSFLDTVREINEAERRAELEGEARAAEEKAARQAAQRKAYEEKLKRERLELIKLKQGVITEESKLKAEPVPERTYTVGERISNFFYHNKWYVIAGAFFAALAAFLIYDYVRVERPDIQGLYIAADYDMSYYCGELTAVWSEYTQDYNNDGKKIAALYYVPSGYADDTAASIYYAQSDRTKLIGEFQSGNTVMIVGDKYSYQSIGALDGVFYDCRELFPDDPYAEELGYRLAGTDLMETLGCDTVDDSQLYVSFRKPVKTMSMSEEKMRENFDRTTEFWKEFLKDHRVDGLELEPTDDPEPIDGEYGENYAE
ncbi:MAG: hypothetical protein NC120_11670 [Ruminococcus sp.]|nr:hypothetical protein [Ruminococcus sp.]